MSKKRKSAPKSNPVVKILLAVVFLAIIGFFAYSVNLYLGEAAEQNGIVVCDDARDACKISLHIHAQTHPTVCGEKMRLPLETGALDDLHTHKERNLIHFHDALKYDAATDRNLEPERLMVGRFFDNMGVRFTSECLGDKCNGDSCSGVPGKLTMTVNGVLNTDYRNYVWKDGDEIVIMFE